MIASVCLYVGGKCRGVKILPLVITSFNATGKKKTALPGYPYDVIRLHDFLEA